MTLVALLSIKGVPLLIGDALVTGDSGNGDQFIAEENEIPTLPPKLLNKLLPLSGTSFTIHGTRQKVAILSDALAVGWVDSPLVAQIVINDLAEAASQMSLSLDEIEQFLSCRTDEQFLPLGCSLVGWVVDNGIPVSFLWDSRSPSSSFISGIVSDDTPFALGTGAESFYTIFQTPVIANAPFDTNDPVDYAKYSALCHISTLLGHELTTTETALRRYGGAYEVIFFAEGKFQYFDDFTLLFVGFLLAPNRSPTGLDVSFVQEEIIPLYMEYKFIEDVLVVRRARLDFDESHPIPRLARKQVIVVKPIQDTEVQETDLADGAFTFDNDQLFQKTYLSLGLLAAYDGTGDTATGINISSPLSPNWFLVDLEEKRMHVNISILWEYAKANVAKIATMIGDKWIAQLQSGDRAQAYETYIHLVRLARFFTSFDEFLGMMQGHRSYLSILILLAITRYAGGDPEHASYLWGKLIQIDARFRDFEWFRNTFPFDDVEYVTVFQIIQAQG